MDTNRYAGCPLDILELIRTVGGEFSQQIPASQGHFSRIVIENVRKLILSVYIYNYKYSFSIRRYTKYFDVKFYTMHYK